ncbi:MAG: FmdB family zinc ribbon protein [Planctomycetota bacterium]|jgi:putative FmdB family regulatory protein
MPLYEYQCPNGHSREHVYIRYEDAPDSVDCPLCTEQAERLMGMPNFKLSWVPTVNDTGKVWEGTPLEGRDTTNKLTYKSKKLFFDGSKKTEVNGRSKPKPTRGVAALGQ